MLVDLKNFINENETVAVAVSGGSDSMAMLDYFAHYDKLKFKLIAINVEHGIRGASSMSDTLFVKNYCDAHGIPLLSYSVDSLKKASEEKLSIEQSARILRYECFLDALTKGKCDKIATAHHLSDNVESILLNLFRGTGLKGVSGISTFEGKIIRPFLSVKKSEINEYVRENNIPFVTDETNLKTDYSRNYIRLNVIPNIVKHFPEMERNVERFSLIAKEEDEFLDSFSKTFLKLYNGCATIELPVPVVPLKRALIMALKHLGIEKDWEKSHIDSIVELKDNENGKRVNLPKNVVAYKEYDKIVLVIETPKTLNKNFETGDFYFDKNCYSVRKAVPPLSLNKGLFVDKDKIPKDAVIRLKQDGDCFTKFGGGSKSLSDYFTDKKIPLRVRGLIPVIAVGNEVLAIFGIAISDKVKVDESTKEILELI